MAGQPTYTILALKVGKMFIVEPHRRRWNHQIAKDIGTNPEATFKILNKFEQRGWVRGAMERRDYSMARSARKLYGLTDIGAEAIGALLKPLQLASS